MAEIVLVENRFIDLEKIYSISDVLGKRHYDPTYNSLYFIVNFLDGGKEIFDITDDLFDYKNEENRAKFNYFVEMTRPILIELRDRLFELWSKCKPFDIPRLNMDKEKLKEFYPYLNYKDEG